MSGFIPIAVKQAFAFLAYRSGLLRFWIGRKLGKRPLIVMNHRDLESGTDFSQDGIVVRPETFEKQLLLLNRMFRIVPLASACDETASFRCAVTFDDGWSDNHHVAFPVLRRLGLPATLFITTGYVGTARLFWPERLAFILQDLKPGELPDETDAGLSADVLERLSALPGSGFRDSLNRLIESLKDVDEKTREDFLDRLARFQKTRSGPFAGRGCSIGIRFATCTVRVLKSAVIR